jgi:hypothetical protein
MRRQAETRPSGPEDVLISTKRSASLHYSLPSFIRRSRRQVLLTGDALHPVASLVAGSNPKMVGFYLPTRWQGMDGVAFTLIEGLADYGTEPAWSD